MVDLYGWLFPKGLADESARFVADLAVKSSSVLIVAALVAFVLRRASAARREVVWRAALLVLVALPVTSLLLPRWSVQAFRVAVPAVEMAEAGGTQGGETGAAAEAGAESVSVEAASASDMAPQISVAPALARSVSTRGEAPSWLFLLWATGAVVTVLPLLIAVVRLRSVIERATPARDALQAPDARVLHSPTVPVPMAMRLLPWRKAVVLLPERAREWSDDRCRLVLEHESAHIHRADGAAQFLARVGASLCWFQPLSWWALRRMAHCAELACDDVVVAGGRSPSDYAEHLLDIALSARSARLPGGVVAMAQSHGMKERLEALLKESRSRRPAAGTRRGLALVTAVLLAVPVGTIRGTVAFEVEKNDQERAVTADPVEVSAARGLLWLRKHQDATGGWAQDIGFKFNTRYQVTASAKPHVGVTALVLDAFLAAGHLPDRGPHGECVRRGVGFLLESLEPKTGYINAHGTRLRSHCLATMTLLDVARRTKNEKLLATLQKAIDLLTEHQLRGWRYMPLSTDTDLLASAMGLRVLQAAAAAGLNVPTSNIMRAERTIAGMMHEGGDATRKRPGFKYTPDERARVSWGCTATGTEVYADFREPNRKFLADCSRALVEYRKEALASEMYPRGHYLYWHGLHQHARARARLARNSDEDAQRWKEFKALARQLLFESQNADGSWTCDVGPGAAYGTAVAISVLLMR